VCIGGSATFSVSVSKLLVAPPSAVDDVKAILEDEIVSTTIGGFQRFLVHCKGRPQSDNSYVHEDDIYCTAPDLLDGCIQANSPRVSFPKTGRDDWIIKTYFKKKHKNHN